MATLKSCENLVAREQSDGSYVITLKNVRGSYLHLFEPWAKNADETKKYSGRFILPNGTHKDAIAELRRYLKELQKELFKGPIKPGDLCFRDGEQEGKEEYEDAWVLAASERADRAPALLTPDKRKANQGDDILQSGDFVSVMVKFWMQDNSYGKKINANLLAVQHVRKGERFGGGGVDKDDIDEAFDEHEWEGDDGDDGLDD